MTVRRLLLAAAIAGGAMFLAAPTSSADTACAWVDPHGVCISNPLGNLPDVDVPDAPRVPRLPRLP